MKAKKRKRRRKRRNRPEIWLELIISLKEKGNGVYTSRGSSDGKLFFTCTHPYRQKEEKGVHHMRGKGKKKRGKKSFKIRGTHKKELLLGKERKVKRRSKGKQYQEE